MTENVKDERSELQIPRLLPPDAGAQMAGRQNQRRLLQKKCGAGALAREPGEEKIKKRRRAPALDWKTLEYHPRQKPKFAALDMAKNVEDTGARIRMLFGWMAAHPEKPDKASHLPVGRALRSLDLLRQSHPEISDSVVEIDRAMRNGFAWELGPFELWDAAGVEATVARMKKEGHPVAANVEKLLGLRREIWYEDDPRRPPAANTGIWQLATGNRWLSPRESGRSKSQKNVQRSGQEKFRSVAASTWAMVWAASSSTPK
jgi:3-hydroxyacyl-CoA dehydrogenase